MSSTTKRALALVAAAFVLTAGATTGAVAGDLIGSPDVADNSLRSKDLRDGTIKMKDVNSTFLAKVLNGAAVAGAQGEPGKVGPAGPEGKVGPEGPQGQPGTDGTDGTDGEDGENAMTGMEYRTWDYIIGGKREGRDGAPAGYGGAGSGGIATVACSSADKVAIAGGVQFLGLDADNGNSETADGASVIDSFPGRMDWATNTPRPGRLDGWITRMGPLTKPASVTVWAVCVDAPEDLATP